MELQLEDSGYNYRVDLLKQEFHSRGNGDRARTLQGYGSRKFHRVDGAHAKQVLSALFCSLSILRQNSTHEGTCKDKVHEETAEIHLSKQ